MGTTPRMHSRRRALDPEGLALLGGSLLLGGFMVLGMGAPRNWWSHNVELRFATANAAGISPGMPVKIAGFKVGRVRQVHLLDTAKVQVNLSVGAGQEHMIGPSSSASLIQDNLIDKPYIAIAPDLNRAPASPSSGPRTINYETSPSIAALIRQLAASRIPLEKVITNSANLVERRLPRSLDQLDQTLISGQRLAGSIERELVGGSGNLQSQVGAATSNLERTLDSVQTTLSEIQALARSSNALLQTLSRSWLLQLLQPAIPEQSESDPQLRNKRE